LLSSDTGKPSPDPATSRGTVIAQPNSARSTIEISTAMPKVRRANPSRMILGGLAP